MVRLFCSRGIGSDGVFLASRIVTTHAAMTKRKAIVTGIQSDHAGGFLGLFFMEWNLGFRAKEFGFAGDTGGWV